jgi:hypothetical protein
MLHRPIQAILGLHAAQRNYQAGICDIRSISGYLIGIGGTAISGSCSQYRANQRTQKQRAPEQQSKRWA